MNVDAANAAREALRGKIQPRLKAFADRVTGLHPGLIWNVKATSNDAFLLRGWASFANSVDSEELAVCVDAALEGDKVALISDACVDNGEVLAEGPTLSLQWPFSNDDPSLADWLAAFERFLSSTETIVQNRLDRA